MDKDDLEFIMNTYDQTMDDARLDFSLFYYYQSLLSEDEQWDNHLKLLDKNVICNPKPNQYYSVDQLKSMGLVGVYRVRETNNVYTEALELYEELKNKFKIGLT